MGFNAFSKTLVGFASGQLSQRVMARSLRTQLANLAAMALLNGFVTACLAHLFELPIPADSGVLKATMVELAAGAVLVIPFFYLCVRAKKSAHTQLEA